MQFIFSFQQNDIFITPNIVFACFACEPGNRFTFIFISELDTFNINEKVEMCLTEHLNCGSGADSVQYLTVEGLVSAVQEGIASLQEKDKMISSSNKSSRRVGHCTACLTGKYPVELEW